MTRSTFRLRTPPAELAATPRSDKPRTGVAGRLTITLFFLLWLAIPTVILVVVARDARSNYQTWRWPATQCTILRSSVEPSRSDGDYAFRVEYACPGLLPTLIECSTGATLLRGIVEDLLPPHHVVDHDELIARHRGNVREALRELYDRFAAAPSLGAAPGTSPAGLR